MKCNKKSGVIIGLIILLSLFLVVSLIMLFFFQYILPPSKEMAEIAFDINKSELTTVIEYFNENPDSFYAHKIYARDTAEKIPDDNVKNAVTKLFNRGFVSIAKQGSQITFLLWVRGMDFGAGIAYSYEADVEPYIELGITLDKLDAPQWYYYEAN